MDRTEIKGLIGVGILLTVLFILGFYGAENHKNSMNILTEDDVSISKEENWLNYSFSPYSQRKGFMIIIYRLCLLLICILILTLFFAHLFISYPIANQVYSYKLENLSLIVSNSYFIEI